MQKIFEKKGKEDRAQTGRKAIILGIMFLVLFSFLIYIFCTRKQGFHSDELWSYGYANSYMEKDIYVDADGLLHNVEKWTEGSVLWDYLVVNKEEGFSYKSVYHNQVNDLSPPFHSMILHTICSLFPEHFSKWYAFCINIVSYIVTMIFLYKLTILMSNERQAQIVCLIYGLSRGAIDNFIYLRMYAMCTAMLMVILYCILRLLKRDVYKSNIKYYIGLFIVSTCAFLTHYYMLAICGSITLLFCIYLLFEKKVKRCFIMGFVMLGAAITSLILFPSMLRVSRNQTKTVISENIGDQGVGWRDRFRTVSNFITEKSFGISVLQLSGGKLLLVFGYALYIVVVLVCAMILFRKTKFAQNMISEFKNRKWNVGSILCLQKKVNWIYVILTIVCVFQIYLVAETSNVWGMGDYEDRYLFYIYPIVILIGVGFLCWMVRGLKNKRLRYVFLGIICFLVVAGQLWHQLNGSAYYFCTSTEGMPIEKAVDGKNVVYIEENAWLLTAMSYKLMGCNEYLLTNEALCRFHAIEYLDKMKEGELYLIIDTNYYGSVLSGPGEWEELEHWVIMDQRYDALLEFFEDLVPETKMKFCSKETIFGRPMEVYCINP